MYATWCEVDVDALADNVRTFRRLVGPDVLLAPAVKGGAYGHGLVPAARAFVAGGADWLCIHQIEEARALRAAGVEVPLYCVGPVLLDDLGEVEQLDLRLVAYNKETVERLVALGVKARLHLKIETGNHRQGVEPGEALALADAIRKAPKLTLEGISSHFANIEDTTDHRYARQQLARFEGAVAALRAAGHAVPIRHLSNSAAALLWPDQAFEMVRLGIACYGLWPSKETRVAAALAGRADVVLRPALSWKTRVGQIKAVAEGAFVGYGCSFMTTHATRLAILPVGYWDGYDRKLSNLAHVLIKGRRAPVRGRVCMNIVMVDVTDIPAVALEDEVVLLGAQDSGGGSNGGSDGISAEQLAEWAGTINYEVVTRIADHVPRVAVAGGGRAPAAAVYRAPR